MSDEEMVKKYKAQVDELKRALTISMDLLYSLPGYWGDGLPDHKYEFMQMVLEKYKIV